MMKVNLLYIIHIDFLKNKPIGGCLVSNLNIMLHYEFLWITSL